MTDNATKQAQAEAKQATSAAKEATDAFANGAFEMPAVFRDFAEQATSRAKQNYDAYKSIAEETTDAMEDALSTANKNASDIQRQALASAKAQMNTTFDFAEKMLGAKTISEAVELQTSFMRKQFDSMQSNMKEFQELSQRLQQETTKPFQANISKMMDHWRVGA